MKYGLLRLASTIAAGWLLVSPALSAGGHGKCGFDAATLKFAGSDVQQASCLLRPVGMYAHIKDERVILPYALEELIGTSTADVADDVRQFFAAHQGAPGGDDLTAGLSHAKDGDADAPAARYFVIHDTSSPYFSDLSKFPRDIDDSNAVNRLSQYGGANAKAHVFINRRGEWLTGHDFSVPWRATKLELKVVKTPSKGLFLHIELIQPRISDISGRLNNDAIAPEPGFTRAQYTRLADAYIAASVRGGKWLIPAFHAALDEGLSDGHDDPQHFDLVAFSAAVTSQLGKMTRN